MTTTSRFTLAALSGLVGACALAPTAWTAETRGAPPQWPRDADELVQTAPRAGCPSGGRTASDCERGCRVDVVSPSGETTILHTPDGDQGAEMTRLNDGRLSARRWSQGAAGRIDDFGAGRIDADATVTIEATLDWLDHAAAAPRPARMTFRRVYDSRLPTRASSGERECPTVRETERWGRGCWATTLRRCEVVDLRYGECDGEARRLERRVEDDGSVTYLQGDGSFATTHRDSNGRIVGVQGVFRLFSPDGYPFRVEVTYDADGRLSSEVAVGTSHQVETTRTLAREYDTRGRLVRSALTIQHEGTDELEDVDSIVEYRYGACPYAITALTPEGRHIALTASGADWMAGDMLYIR